jgi:predicted nucleic acid-binding protein
VFLLDTDIVSEIRKRQPHEAVRTWFDSTDQDSLFLSVLVLGEIERGIHVLHDRDPDRAATLAAWLDRLRTSYRDRVLPVDVGVATEWGRLTAHRTVAAIDGLLAATARHHGMTLVTRNTDDVDDLGVSLLNPFVTL